MLSSPDSMEAAQHVTSLPLCYQIARPGIDCASLQLSLSAHEGMTRRMASTQWQPGSLWLHISDNTDSVKR